MQEKQENFFVLLLQITIGVVSIGGLFIVANNLHVIAQWLGV